MGPMTPIHRVEVFWRGQLDGRAVDLLDQIAHLDAPPIVDQVRVSDLYYLRGALEPTAQERIATELGRGMLDEVYVKGENGYVNLRSIGEEAVLTVLARQQTKLGLLFLDMRRASEDLAVILEV